MSVRGPAGSAVREGPLLLFLPPGFRWERGRRCDAQDRDPEGAQPENLRPEDMGQEGVTCGGLAAHGLHRRTDR